MQSFINSMREKYGNAVPEWLRHSALLEPAELSMVGNEVTLEEVRELCR